jgi:hypothetical protein
MSGRRSFRTELLAVVCFLIVFLVTPTASAELSTSVCDSPFDPYAVSTAVLQTCGVQTFPLAAVSNLPDGGTSFDFVAEGTTMTYLVPPPGFSVLTASPASLAMYGIPARPDGGSALQQWQDTIGRLSLVTPPPFLAAPQVSSGGVTAARSSGSWSGKVAHKKSTSYFYSSTAEWGEPGAYATSCSNNSAFFWSGIGGWNSGTLAQGGTAINTPGLGQHQAWTEVLPDQPYVVAQPVYGQRDGLFEAVVNHRSGGFNILVENVSSGAGTIVAVNSSHWDGSTAESIVERPTVNNSLRALTNFQQVSFVVNGANSSQLNSFSFYTVNMVNPNNGHLLAVAKAFDSSGAFNDAWGTCI